MSGDAAMTAPLRRRKTGPVSRLCPICLSPQAVTSGGNRDRTDLVDDPQRPGFGMAEPAGLAGHDPAGHRRGRGVLRADGLALRVQAADGGEPAVGGDFPCRRDWPRSVVRPGARGRLLAGPAALSGLAVVRVPGQTGGEHRLAGGLAVRAHPAVRRADRRAAVGSPLGHGSWWPCWGTSALPRPARC